MLGDKYTDWQDTEYLLAVVIDQLNWLIWSKTADGQKGRNRPEPIPRPGVKPDQRTQVRGQVMTLAEADKLQ
ncbi:DUF5361 domain-containing protein [Arcanobacterium phocae]|uniref:DUF5361 domain-containing protein n=1 Tax=Arcanobacterium phocae TaxID=131112 RepID=UPI001C0EADED|nr:DUF5361 domain-containing protein [Arcanobacterium phocae]